MDDKEVGRLWHKRLMNLEADWPNRKGAKAFEMDMVIGLIRKLVEERRNSKLLFSQQTQKAGFLGFLSPKTAEESALRDFGIDPATWPKEHK